LVFSFCCSCLGDDFIGKREFTQERLQSSWARVYETLVQSTLVHYVRVVERILASRIAAVVTRDGEDVPDHPRQSGPQFGFNLRPRSGQKTIDKRKYSQERILTKRGNDGYCN